MTRKPEEAEAHAVGRLAPGHERETPTDEPLAVYRLTPLAEATDSRWDVAPSHGTVFVRARSAADARVAAAEAEIDFLDISAKPSHGVSTDFASAFRDTRLYSVTMDESGRFSAEGPRGVLSRGEAEPPA